MQDRSRMGHKLIVKAYSTNQLVFVGEITIRASAESYRGRLSDFMNDANSFIPMTDVNIYSNDGKLISTTPFLCVNKQAIIFLVEEETPPSANKIEGEWV